MKLNSGVKLGAYEIVAPLGAGGMGEVYRAKDLKLKRDVAIKILPEDFARDGERVMRFRREAEVLASLNHPAIATIYGFEESGESLFLVLAACGRRDSRRSHSSGSNADCRHRADRAANCGSVGGSS